MYLTRNIMTLPDKATFLLCLYVNSQLLFVIDMVVWHSWIFDLTMDQTTHDDLERIGRGRAGFLTYILTLKGESIGCHEQPMPIFVDFCPMNGLGQHNY
ncbi:hypothetical protein CsSME_00044847 [Camellia sinensis var. sinensis]